MKPGDYGAPSDRETFYSKRVATVRFKQVKAHSRMMRNTGSAPPYTADDKRIQKGDYVRVRRDAFEKYGDSHEADGAPMWHTKVYRVTEVINFGERYRLEGFGTKKDGTVREFWNYQVQKYNHVRVGDIVRVSMEMYAKYRAYVQSKVRGNKNNEALMFNHSFTRSLFRVTGMDESNTHYFLELVWDPTTPLDKRVPFPLLKFETEIGTTKEQAQKDVGTDVVLEKDKFRGFRPSMLLVADQWTNDLFNDPKTTPAQRQNAYTACVLRNQVKGKGSEQLVAARKMVDRRPAVGSGGKKSCDARHALKQHLANQA